MAAQGARTAVANCRLSGFSGPTTPLLQANGPPHSCERLGELGWIEGRTIAIEFRWGEGHGTLAPRSLLVFAA